MLDSCLAPKVECLYYTNGMRQVRNVAGLENRAVVCTVITSSWEVMGSHVQQIAVACAPSNLALKDWRQGRIL